MTENNNIPEPREGKKLRYRKRVYKFLSNKFSDFKRNESDFYNELDSNPEYASKVYDVIYDNFGDFKKGKDEFVGLMTISKKKEPSTVASRVGGQAGISEVPLGKDKGLGEVTTPKRGFIGPEEYELPKPEEAKAPEEVKITEEVKIPELKVPEVKLPETQLQQQVAEEKPKRTSRIVLEQKDISPFLSFGPSFPLTDRPLPEGSRTIYNFKDNPDAIASESQKYGVKPESLSQVLKDVSADSDDNKIIEAAKVYQYAPSLYKKTIASASWAASIRNGLLQEVKEGEISKEDADNIYNIAAKGKNFSYDPVSKQYVDLNYDEAKSRVLGNAELIKRTVKNTEEQKKALEDLKTDQAGFVLYRYGTSPENQQKWKSINGDLLVGAGLDVLKMTEPEKASEIEKVFSNPDSTLAQKVPYFNDLRNIGYSALQSEVIEKINARNYYDPQQEDPTTSKALDNLYKWYNYLDKKAKEDYSAKYGTQIQEEAKTLEEKAKQERANAPILNKAFRGFSDIASGLSRGAAGTFVNTVDGFATLIKNANLFVPGADPTKLTNFLAKKYEGNIDELFPQTPEFKNSIADQLSQALGQVAAMVLAARAGGGGGRAAAGLGEAIPQTVVKAGATTQAAVSAAAKQLVSGLSNPASVVGALNVGQQEYRRAKEAGASDEQAFEAFVKNGVGGSVLEQIPVMKFFERLNKATSGGVLNYIKTKAVGGITGGIEEMTTEVLQQLYANKTAKDIYNINQDLFEGVTSSGGIGFGAGFILNAMGQRANILRKEGKVKEAQSIEDIVGKIEQRLNIDAQKERDDLAKQGVVLEKAEVTPTAPKEETLTDQVARQIEEQEKAAQAVGEVAPEAAPQVPAAPEIGSLRDVELSMRRPDKNEVIFVPIDALLQKHAKDQPSYDIQKPENRIKGRVEKAKEFIKNYIKDQRAIDPKTGERMKTKVSFEPSVLDIDENGKISFEDGRHRVLAAKELGLTEVPIEVPKEKIKAVEDLLVGEVAPEAAPQVPAAPVERLEKEYRGKTVEELVALKKQLYPSPDIETPMSAEEKLLDRVIADKFSEINQSIVAKRKAAEESPRFTSYDDAQKWIEDTSKKYKSKNEFLASQEYKDALPDINALYKVEKADYSKKAKDAMDESGVKIGDRVIYDYVTPFGAETYSGKIVERDGIPFVRFDEGQKTMSGKQSVRWHKGFVKEAAAEAKPELPAAKIENPKVVITGTRNGLENLSSNNYDIKTDAKIKDARGREGQFENGVLIEDDGKGNTIINIKTDAVDSFGRRGFLQASVIVPKGTEVNPERIKSVVEEEVKKLRNQYNTLELGQVQQADLVKLKDAVVRELQGAGEVVTEAAPQVPAKAAPEPTQKFGVGFAPFREKNVFTEQEDVDIRSDALASELLDILGTPEVVAGKVAPAEVFTKDNLDDISKDGLNDVQSKVVDDVKNVVKSISNLVENTTGNELKVTIHKDQDTYGDAVINAGGTKQDSYTKGFYLDADGTIHLNMARVTSETMLHEGFHPVLDFIAKNNPEVIDAFYAQLGKLDGGKAIIDDTIKAYRGSDETAIKKEAITDFVAKVADGSFEVNQTNFEKVKAFILDLIKKLGFDLTTDIADINDVRELAKFISDKFSSGKEIMSKEFIPVKNDGEPGEVSGAGRLDNKEIANAKVPGKNPLKFSKEKFKEVVLVSLPEVSLEEKAKQFNNKAIAINSDPTRVGELALPSGKKIFMYGGLNYTALEPNVKGEIGFTSTTLSKPKQVSGFIKSLFPETDGVGLVLTTSQKPESMLGNAYSLEYVLDAISQLPPKILRSSEFRREFFGKDILAVREAFGKKEYNEFIKKYGKADLGSPEVIQAMVEELLTDVGNNFIARNSLVSNMLAGVVEKSTRAATKGEKGFVSVTPNKFIAKVLFDNFGLNQEKLFNEIGEKGIVDAYMNEGKWGFITGGFESDSKVDYMSIQDKGVIHPQFNAKFHGKNAFLLDGAYMIDKLFKTELLEKNKKGELYIDSKTGLPKPYEKKASLMVAGSMYPKGVIEVASPEFSKPIPQFSRPIELDVIEGFYSPIQKRILEFKQPKASATKWKEIVGVKSDEAVFSGLADWLNSQKPDAQLSKQDVINFMKDNRIEIKEMTKSDERPYDIEKKRLFDKYGVTSIEELRDNATEAEMKKLFSQMGGSVQTKYSQYQLPGGENYKEILITLPFKNKLFTERDELAKKQREAFNSGNYELANKIDNEISGITKKLKEQNSFGTEKEFKSTHFDESNIITHLRMNTRTDADGKKVLFLEEVQSDWGQKGKREGFSEATPSSSIKAVSDYNMIVNEKNELLRQAADYVTSGRIPELQSKVDEINNRIEDAKSKLPDNAVVNFDSGLADIPVRKPIASAPFVTNTNAWVKLGLKYALKEAVRQGADRIAWTTGSQQNERYSLSKSVDSIQYAKTGDDSFLVSVTGKNGEEVLYNTGMSLKNVEATLGKDIADKINSGFGEEEKAKQRSVSDLKSLPTIKGEGLEVGGKGMKAFYDKIVPDVAKSLVKELTGKQGEVGEAKIQVGSMMSFEVAKTTDDIKRLGKSGSYTFMENGNPISKSRAYELIENGEQVEARFTGSSTQQSIDITPELRQSVQGGMPQFSRDNQLLKIKDFVQAQRNKGVSDDVIREALDKVSGKVGLTKQEIDNLMAGEFPTKPKEYAIQEPTAGEVPVQPEARAGEKVEAGVPPTEPPKTPEEGKAEGEEKRLSGIKKGLVSQEILGSVNFEKTGDKELLEKGRQIIESGEVNPRTTVDRIVDEGRGVLSPAEVVALIYYKADLDTKVEDLTSEMERMKAAGEDLGDRGVQLKDLEVQQRNFDIAAVITAQQQSMSFRLRRWMLDRAYSLQQRINNYKKVNDGTIPEDVQKKFEEWDKELQSLRKQIRDAEIKKADQDAEVAVDNIVEDVNREDARQQLSEQEIEQRVQKGVEAEINRIYEQLPAKKKSRADQAIAALDRIQARLRNKTYDAGLGIPVAIIDAGITTIKGAIKAGVAIEKAIQLGIDTIKQKLNGKPFDNENNFRQDLLDGFKAEGIKTEKEASETPSVNEDGSLNIPEKFLRDLVRSGKTNIEQLTDAVLKELETQLPGLTKRQVRDAITEYGRTVNPTKDDIRTQLGAAKRIGRLISEIEDLQGMSPSAFALKYYKSKPKNTSQKERLLKAEVRNLIKTIKADPSLLPLKDAENLNRAKENAKRRIEELQDRISSKDYSKKPKPVVKADAELEMLNAQKEALQERFEEETKLAEIRNRTKLEKVKDFVQELLSNLPRALTTTLDLSAMFVQGTWRVFTSPIRSAKAFAEGLRQLVSPRRMEKFMSRYKSTYDYVIARNSGLAISSPESKASENEQLFVIRYANAIYDTMANIVTLGYKPAANFVKAINPLKASQRAFEGYINYIRISTFKKMSDSLRNAGYNPEYNPEVFKSAADFVNTTTGRANLGALETSSKWLSTIFFAPKKVAAELKLFSPYAFVYYAKMPAPVRKKALMDFAKFSTSVLATHVALRAALEALGEEQEDDFWNPKSPNFMSFKIGEKRLSVLGGAKSTIVFMSRVLGGNTFVDKYGEETKFGERVGKKINTKFDLITRFVAGKFAPVAGAARDYMDRNPNYEDDDEIYKNLVTPIWMQDLNELYKDDSVAVTGMFNLLSIVGANITKVDFSEVKDQITFTEKIPGGFTKITVGGDTVYKKGRSSEVKRIVKLTEAQKEEFQNLADERFKVEMDKIAKIVKEAPNLSTRAKYTKIAVQKATEYAQKILEEKYKDQFKQFPIKEKVEDRSEEVKKTLEEQKKKKTIIF